MAINEAGGNLKVDGKYGHKTLQAINSVDSKKLFDAFQQKRIDHYNKVVRDDPKQRDFIKGWINRTNRIRFEN
jgi:lysozyme family protein